MDQLAIAVIGIALIFLGNKYNTRIFNLASAILFVYLVFNNLDPFLMLAFSGVAISQFYTTFFSKD